MGVVRLDLELAIFLLGIVALVAGVWLWLGLGQALVVLGMVLTILALAIANRAQLEETQREALAALKREREGMN